MLKIFFLENEKHKKNLNSDYMLFLCVECKTNKGFDVSVVL